MAGRGRGRGRGTSINIEALGLGREEMLPPVAQPPPLFPPLQFKPVPLTQSDELNYLLALKQELREAVHKSPFFVKAPNKVKDIQRYSDKYQPGACDSTTSWTLNVDLLPWELRDHPRKKRKVAQVLKPKVAKTIETDDVSKLLEKFEEKDTAETVEETDETEVDDEEKKKNKEDEDEEEEEYDEEDAEEETDYNQAYFDNGEDYGDDDEDDDEGPTY